MKFRTLLLVVIAANIVLAATAQVSGTVRVSNFPAVVKTDPVKTQWQYKYVTLKTLLGVESDRDLLQGKETLAGMIEAALNRLGREGWELIHVSDQEYLFKRPVS